MEREGTGRAGRKWWSGRGRVEREGKCGAGCDELSGSRGMVEREGKVERGEW